MNSIDPFSIPPPRGWSPSVDPRDQIVLPPIGSSLQPDLPLASSWLPPTDSPQVQPALQSAPPSYPIQPPVGSSPQNIYQVSPPRGWTPSVNPAQQIIPPPIGAELSEQPLMPPPPQGSQPDAYPIQPPRGWPPTPR